MRFPIILKKIIVLPLFLCIFFTACEEEDDDYSISEITIYNIPAKIPVRGSSDPVILYDTFKVYLNASNYMSPDAPSVTKGVAKISEDNLESNGTYTVRIKLQNPNRPDIFDPTTDTGLWFHGMGGTANFYSIVISPQNIRLSAGGPNAIWAKAGYTLDIGKERCDWNNISMDFRKLIGTDLDTPTTLDISTKNNALYFVVTNDGEITSKE